VFTGIVEELGRVVELDRGADAARLTVSGDVLAGLAAGDSVSVNGVCLTAQTLLADGFVADVMAESLQRTGLGRLAVGDRVNLERAVTPSSRLGGHIVQGHVDGVAIVVSRQPAEHWELVTLRLPEDLIRYVVPKGSITLDGVSLTVVSIDGDQVTVSLIPETLRRTTFGTRGVGEPVNVEVDVLAKYVERLLAARPA
jgi:riboflavin synthase